MLISWWFGSTRMGKRDLKKWIRYRSQKNLKNERYYSQVQVQKCFSLLGFVVFALLLRFPSSRRLVVQDAAPASLDSAGTSWPSTGDHCCRCSSHHWPPRGSSPDPNNLPPIAPSYLGWPPSCPCRTDPSERKTVPYSERMLSRSMTTVTDENKRSFCFIFISWEAFMNPMVIIRIKNITKQKTNPNCWRFRNHARPIITGIWIKAQKLRNFLYQLRFAGCFEPLTAQ